MKFLKNISVKWQVLLIVASASLVTAAVSLILDYRHGVIHVKNEVMTTTVLTTNVLANSCAVHVKNKDLPKIINELKKQLQFSSPFVCVVYDKHGKRLAQYAHPSVDSIYDIKGLNPRKEWTAVSKSVHVYKKITLNKHFYGNIYVRCLVDYSTLNRGIVTNALYLFFTIVLFSVIIMFLLHKIISKPLVQLSRFTRDISSSKNYNVRIKNNSTGEIGSLCDDFNLMLDALCASNNERRAAQDELIDTNRTYKTLVDNIPGVVIRMVFDKFWFIDYFGPGITDLTGYPLDYFINKNISVLDKIIAPEQRLVFFQEIFDNTGKETEFENLYKIYTKTGTLKWILVKGKFIVDPITKKITMDGVLFDRTEQEKSHEQLKKTEMYYRMLFENLNDAAILIDSKTGVIVETNAACQQVFGLEREILVGTYYTQVINNVKTSFATTDALDEVIGIIQDFNAEIVNAEGRTYSTHVKSSFVTIGDTEYLLCLIRDVTNQVYYEQNLKIAKEKAEESDRLKTMFLSNMSHEIRTPMNGILGFSKLLLLPASDEEKAKYLSIIESSGKQLLRIIDDILDISKIETGQMLFNNAEFRLNLLLDEIVKITNNQLASKEKILDIRLMKRLKDGNDIIIADRNRLYQVIINLVNNAEKFTEKGFVEIGYEVLDDLVIQFYVRDTGIGISDDKKEIVFRRFCQADSSITTKYGGTGLGLPIAKGLIEKFGGKFWFESKVGEGSIFYFTLPGVFVKA